MYTFDPQKSAPTTHWLMRHCGRFGMEQTITSKHLKTGAVLHDRPYFFDLYICSKSHMPRSLNIFT